MKLPTLARARGLFGRPVLSSLIGVLLLGLGSTARADIGVFTSPDSFNASVNAIGTDTFFGISQQSASQSALHRRTLLGETYHYDALASTSTFLGAGSPQDTWLTPNVATDTITFTNFKEGVTAFGGYFFGSNFSGQYLLGDVTLSVTDANGLTVRRTIDKATTTSFLGFASHGAQIVSVSLYGTQLPSGDSLWPAARQVTMGQAVSAVPEPASGALMLLGLSGLALARQRVRRREAAEDRAV